MPDETAAADEDVIRAVARALHCAWCSRPSCDYGHIDREEAEAAVQRVRKRMESHVC